MAERVITNTQTRSQDPRPVGSDPAARVVRNDRDTARQWNPTELASTMVTQPELDAALGGGGGGGSDPGGSFVTRAPGAITAADNGRWIGAAAAGTFTLPPVAGLPDGFEVRVYYPTGLVGTVGVDPDDADHIDLMGSTSGAAGQAVTNTNARAFLHLKRSDVANTWVAYAQGGGWAHEIVNAPLEVSDLSGPVPEGLRIVGPPAPAGTYTITGQKVDPLTGGAGVTTFGSVDQTNAYTDGGSEALSGKGFMLVIANAGGAPVSWMAGHGISVRPADPSAWNVPGGPPGPLTFSFQAPYAIPAGTTATLYCNHGPDDPSARMYERSVGAGPIRTFAQAVANGAV